MKITFAGKCKDWIIRALLWLLNTEFLNQSPCKYGYINGLEAISFQDLLYEYKQEPTMTVGGLIDAINRFNSCPMNNDGLTVIESDGSTREGDIWDVHQLRQSLVRSKTSPDGEAENSSNGTASPT